MEKSHRLDCMTEDKKVARRLHDEEQRTQQVRDEIVESDAQRDLELESQESEDSDSTIDRSSAAADPLNPSGGGRSHVLSSPVPRRQQPGHISTQAEGPPIVKSVAEAEKVLPAFTCCCGSDYDLSPGSANVRSNISSACNDTIGGEGFERNARKTRRPTTRCLRCVEKGSTNQATKRAITAYRCRYSQGGDKGGAGSPQETSATGPEHPPHGFSGYRESPGREPSRGELEADTEPVGEECNSNAAARPTAEVHLIRSPSLSDVPGGPSQTEGGEVYCGAEGQRSRGREGGEICGTC